VSNSGRGSGLGKPSSVIRHESTVKATFSAPCEPLGGDQERKPGAVVRKLRY